MKFHLYLNGKLKRPHKRNLFENLEYFKDIIKFSVCDEYNPMKSKNHKNHSIELQDGTRLKINYDGDKYNLEILN